MSASLEERYRSLLRILPADYRADWEEEMVATFLAAELSDDRFDDPEDAEVHAELGRPGLSEMASVLGLAIKLRLPGVGHGARRPQLAGEAVRLVAVIGLLVSAATSAVSLAVHLWLAGRPAVPDGMPTGTVPTAQALLVTMSVPAYLALVAGHRSAARLLASISVGAVVVIAVGDLVAGSPFLAGRWVALLLDLLVFATLWAHHDESPPLARRPWLWALPAAVGVAAAAVAATAAFGVTWWLLDWPALSCTVVVGALAAQLARRGGPAWSLALSLLAGVVLAQRLVTLPEFVASSADGRHGVVLAAGLAEAAAVLLVGLPVALRARRAWSELPPEPALL